MSIPIIEIIGGLLESVFGYAMGSTLFYLMVGVSAFAWIIAARLFMGMFSSKRGFIAAILALVIPLAISLVAYGVVELYVVPLVEADWSPMVLPWVGFGVFLFLSILLIARRIFDLSAGVAIFVYLVGTGAAVGAFIAVQVTLGVIEFGEQQVEHRERRVKDEIESLF